MPKPVNLEVGSADGGASFFIHDTDLKKYFNWRYPTIHHANVVKEYIRGLWNQCPLDRIRDGRNYFSHIIERTNLTEISIAQLHEQWVPGFSHDTFQRSGY